MALPKPLFSQREFKLIGQLASESVALPFKLSKEDEEDLNEVDTTIQVFFGQVVCTLITKAMKIKRLSGEPPIGERMRSLQTLKKKTDGLRVALAKHNSKWHMPNQRFEPHFDPIDSVTHVFDIAAQKDEEKLLADADSMLEWLSDYIEGQICLADHDGATSHGFAYFVRYNLSQGFEYFFSAKPGYSYSEERGAYSGPFVRFARFIFDKAEVSISDAAICRALARAKREK